MTGKLMGRVLLTPMKEPGAKLVLMAYAWHADDDGTSTYPAVERVMNETDQSERTVRAWVKWLKDPAHPYLLPDGKEKHGNNRYRINLALLAEAKEGANSAPLTPREGAKSAPQQPKEGAVFAPPEPPKTNGGAEIAPLGVQNLHLEGAESAPNQLITSQLTLRKEEEEESPAAAANEYITAQRAERIYTEVTGMVSIPGSLDSQGQVISNICNLADQHGSQTATYLRPYYLAQINTCTRQGRPYQKTGLFWLNEWAIADQLPDYVTQQLRHKFKDLPAELVNWMLARDQAKAGITPTPNGNGSSKSMAHFNDDTRRAAEELGLVPPKKGAQ